MYVCMHDYRFVILTADMNLKLISCHKGKGADDFNRLINEGSTLPFTYIHTHTHTYIHADVRIHISVYNVNKICYIPYMHTYIQCYSVSFVESSYIRNTYISCTHYTNTNSVCMYVCRYCTSRSGGDRVR